MRGTAAIVVALLLVTHGASSIARHPPRTDADTGSEIYEMSVAIEGKQAAQALRGYVSAAEHGEARAARRLGEIYEQGLLGVARDPNQAATWYAAARALSATTPGSPASPSGTGDAELLYKQAEAAERAGRGREALTLYMLAARAGFSRAALRLGEIYELGQLGVRRDFDEALRWREIWRAQRAPAQQR